MDHSVPEHFGQRTTSIIDFVAETNFEEFPETVIERTKLTLLDTIGSLLAASHSKYDPGRILTEFVERNGGTPVSSVVGYGMQTSPPNAALVNGTMGYFCDLDAHHPEAITHTPAIMIPSALAIGEQENASGEDLLEAILLGIETSCRVSLALNPNVLYDQGFHPTPVTGGFGSAMAAGKILDLNPNEYGIALGLAQTQASGVLAWKEEHTESFRPFNPGMAARNGVTSAQLAAANFGSPVDPFQGQYNIFRAFSNGSEHIERLDKGLGDSYALMDHAFKQYSSVAFSHPSLDALLELRDRHDIDPEEISQLRVRFPATGTELIEGTELKSHSLPYLLAIAAVEGEVLIDYIVEDRSTEPTVQRLLEDIEIIRDDELDQLFPERYASIVELETDTDTYSERIDYAKGTPEKPFSKSDIEKKFRWLAESTTTEAQREQIIDMVYNIENLEDVTELGALLRKNQQ